MFTGRDQDDSSCVEGAGWAREVKNGMLRVTNEQHLDSNSATGVADITRSSILVLAQS